MSKKASPTTLRMGLVSPKNICFILCQPPEPLFDPVSALRSSVIPCQPPNLSSKVDQTFDFMCEVEDGWWKGRVGGRVSHTTAL